MGLRWGLVSALIALSISASALGSEAVEISVQDVSISVLESGGRVSASADLAYPAKADHRLRLDHTQTLKLAFTVVSQADSSDLVRPQQAFLRLTAPSGDAAYFSALKTKEGSLAVSATSAGVQKQMGTQGGTYSVALLLAGTNLATPVEWELANLELLHPPQDDGTQPLDTPLHATATLFAPKKEMVHMHRAPERRTPALVSLFVTAATLLPMAAFFLALLQLGANTKGLPTTGTSVLWALGFWGGIAATLGLLLLFWLRLNLMQLIPWLAVLAPITTVCGSKALAGAAATRKKQE